MADATSSPRHLFRETLCKKMLRRFFLKKCFADCFFYLMFFFLGGERSWKSTRKGVHKKERPKWWTAFRFKGKRKQPIWAGSSPVLRSSYTSVFLGHTCLTFFPHGRVEVVKVPSVCIKMGGGVKRESHNLTPPPPSPHILIL